MRIPGTREELHHAIYLFGLALLVSCLPLSKYFLSIAQIIIAINWVLQGNFREKARLLRSNAYVLLLPGVALVYFISLLYSSNTDMGLIRANNVIIMVVLPLLMVTSPALSGRNIKHLLLLFSFAVIAAATVSAGRYYVMKLHISGDFRQASFFMLHLRYALMVVMAVYIFLYYALNKNSGSTKPEKALYLISAIFLTIYLYILRSFGGMAIFVLAGFAFVSLPAFNAGKLLWKSLWLLSPVIIMITLIAVISITWFRNFHASPGDSLQLESYTVNGNPYSHDTLSGILENGNLTNVYVCEGEMAAEWNTISMMPFDGKDLKGQQLSMTLRRYLTSKELRKDSAGIRQLDSSDILQIEKGLANYRFRQNPGIHQRLYETLYEIHVWKETGYMKMHSLGQRLAFTSVAGSIFTGNIWKGVGVGDVYDEMKQKALEKNLEIDPLWEGKPHNQYLFFLVAFGLPGFILISFCLLYPVWINKAYNNVLFNVFAVIIIVSMFILDTLESYFSIAFFVFFYTLLVFLWHKKNSTVADAVL